jgi:translation initiation factor 4E
MEISESSNLTRLLNEYTLWFTFFKKPQDRQVDEFEDNLKEIGSFGTAEEFWGIYQHMKRPNGLPRGCEFFLFKKGVRPLWEDEANQGRGRCFISVKKNQPNNKLWEDLLISTLMLNKDFDLVNGIVLNVRTYEVYISVWTKPIDEEGTAQVKNWMRNSMELGSDIPIEYPQASDPRRLGPKTGKRKKGRRGAQATRHRIHQTSQRQIRRQNALQLRKPRIKESRIANSAQRNRPSERRRRQERNDTAKETAQPKFPKRRNSKSYH